MNKKAASMILLTFEVVIVVLVIVLTSSIAQALGSKDSTIRLTQANDIRFMVNALAGVPGDAVLYYPKNATKYTYILGQDRIVILKKGEAKDKRLQIRFFLPDGYSAQGNLEGKPYLCLEKTNKIIKLRPCEEDEIV